MSKPVKSHGVNLALIIPLILAGYGSALSPAMAQNNSYYNDTPRKHACANHKKKKKNKILGALGGAAVGGFVGRKIDGGNHRETGTILGALGGAIAGQAIAGKLSSCDRYLQDEAAVRAIESGNAQNWSNNDSGYGGTTERAQSFVDGQGRPCNTITTKTADQNGYNDPETIILCKNANGTWDRM